MTAAASTWCGRWWRRARQAIENAFFMHSAQQHWVLQAHSTPGYVDSQPDLLLAWDQDGRLHALNSKARQALRRRFGQVPEYIGDVFDLDALRAVTDQSTQQLHWLGEPALHVRVNAPRRKPARGTANTQVDPRGGTPAPGRAGQGPQPAGAGAGNRRRQGSLRPPVARTQRPARGAVRGGERAAIPENLIESELFGYVAGAFTGASSKGMPGLLVQADGGTLFLDEIGDMPLGLQTRLLRVMAEGEVAPWARRKPARWISR
jgi:transcriptional regulator of acetoin/glycerol metabolism